jgi:leader peptidase (prepilin peptidase)/N-methyltransferase|tara:strand:- start:346 stop:1236 length:891 start_codon:yes stop_codon:yes gene_type:complete
MVEGLDQLLAPYLRYPWLGYGGAAVVGLIAGSFLNVVTVRLPRLFDEAESVAGGGDGAIGAQTVFNRLWGPRSRCPQCGRSLPWHENLPVVSYVLLRGCCAGCGRTIGRRYPVVELACVLVSLSLVWALGFEVRTLSALVLGLTLVAISVIDLEHGVIIEAMVQPLIWGGLVLNALEVFVPAGQAVLGAATGYLVLLVIYWAYLVLRRREGIGNGDFLVAAALGSWLGLGALPVVLGVAFVSGAVVGTLKLISGRSSLKSALPFVPFLAFGGWVELVSGDLVRSGYAELIGALIRI